MALSVRRKLALSAAIGIGGLAALFSSRGTPIMASQPLKLASGSAAVAPKSARVKRMEEVWKSGYYDTGDEYEQLCAQATSEPRIGMTRQEARETKWCFPHKINRTTTANGERDQEVYCSSYRCLYISGYLYFTNGILTSIQESQ